MKPFSDNGGPQSFIYGVMANNRRANGVWHDFFSVLQLWQLIPGKSAPHAAGDWDAAGNTTCTDSLPTMYICIISTTHADLFSLSRRLPSLMSCSRNSLNLCWISQSQAEVHFSEVETYNVLFLNNPFAPFHSTGEGGLSIPRIIINQLKWLDRVVDSKVVVDVMRVAHSLWGCQKCIFTDLLSWPVIYRSWPQSSWSWCQ